MQKALLARRRHGHEQAISLARRDIGDNLALVGRREIAVAHAGKFQPRPASPGLGCGALQHVAFGAKNIRVEPLVRAALEQRHHQIAARNARRTGLAEQFETIDNAHAVDADNIALYHIPSQLRVASHLDQLGNIERHMAQGAARAHCIDRALHRRIEREKIDRRFEKGNPQPSSPANPRSWDAIRGAAIVRSGASAQPCCACETNRRARYPMFRHRPAPPLIRPHKRARLPARWNTFAAPDCCQVARSRFSPV